MNTDAIEELIEHLTKWDFGQVSTVLIAEARDQLERLKGEVATLNEAIVLKVNNCQQERATIRAKLAELERERLYEGKAAVQWYNAYLLEYNGRWADDREHKDALAELRRRLSQNAYIAASKQVEIERLRGLLKEAHDAMHSWHSSEYADHPLSIKVSKGLQGGLGDAWGAWKREQELCQGAGVVRADLLARLPALEAVASKADTLLKQCELADAHEDLTEYVKGDTMCELRQAIRAAALARDQKEKA